MQKKYLAIYKDLVKKIKDHHWNEQEMLPSENELSKMYDVSRETIRKTLDMLVQEGYIQKVRGKGSVIINRHLHHFPVSGIQSFKELSQKLNLDAKTFVHQLVLKKPRDEIRDQLNLSKDERVWSVARIREIDGERIILDKDYFVKAYVPELTVDVCEDSIYEYLEGELGLKISFAEKEITVEEPTDEDYTLLDMEGFSNIVVIKSRVYLKDASLFQYTVSRHRPDKFKFVDFARRS